MTTTEGNLKVSPMSGMFQPRWGESLKGDFALRLVFLWAHLFLTRIRTQQPCPQWFRTDLGRGKMGMTTKVMATPQGDPTVLVLESDGGEIAFDILLMRSVMSVVL